MRFVLFDLGDTLIDDANRPIAGAMELLESLRSLRDADGRPIQLGLVSDYTPAATRAEVKRLQMEYYGIIREAGIEAYFLPVEQHVTLSTEVGVNKPDPAIFRAAVDKLAPGTLWQHVVFVTENAAHVKAARELGMRAIHVRGPGQQTGDVDRLSDLIPIFERLVKFRPCSAKRERRVVPFTSFANKSKQVDPVLASIASQVNPARIRTWMEQLTDFKTRWSFSPQINRVWEWIRGEFLAMGYSPSEVRYQPFSMVGAGELQNVLCGSAAGNHPGFVLVCGHYDTTSEQPAVLAPGADDNASGIAVLLEAASILRILPQRRSVLFAAFGGEEEGLHGSQACAEIAATEQWKIDLVVNLDMIAYQDPHRLHHTVVEWDQGNHEPGNDAAAKAYGLLMAQMAADYTALVVEHTDISDSDYMPFEAKGYPCIGVYEAGHNPANHGSGDTMADLDMHHLSEITKMVLATVYSLVR